MIPVTSETASFTVVFASSTASYVASYVSILLLRDNIQHHLQCGRLTPGYALIHAIAEPPFPRPKPQLARHLWGEVSLGFRGIAGLQLSQLAISIRTRGLLTGVRELPAVRGTALASIVNWQVPLEIQGKNTLGEVFDDVRAGLARVTRFGSESGHIDIVTPSSLFR